jgi:hypothetical protein
VGSGGGKPLGRTPRSAVEALLVRNLDSLVKLFSATRGGYFGEQSQRGTRRNRTLRSGVPEISADRFFALASRNGIVRLDNGGAIEIAAFGEAEVSFRRERSSDGSPVIEITFGERVNGFPEYQKIRFEGEL